MLRARDRFTETGDYEDPAAPLLLLDDEELVAGWDADIGQLLAEARAARSGDQVIELPASLSTTAVMRLATDPDAYAAELARPMPRAPVPRRPLRHPVPPVDRAILRPGPGHRLAGPAAAGRPGRPARPGGRRDRGRAGTARAGGGLRGRTVRRDHPVRDRGPVRGAGQRPAAPGPDRCDLCADRSARPTAISGSGWSIGRPAVRRRPTRCSWRSTGWPGPRPTSCRWSRSMRVSTTSGPIVWSGPPELATRAEIERLLGDPDQPAGQR